MLPNWQRTPLIQLFLPMHWPLMPLNLHWTLLPELPV
jgi:hypothetical protein